VRGFAKPDFFTDCATHADIAPDNIDMPEIAAEPMPSTTI